MRYMGGINDAVHIRFSAFEIRSCARNQVVGDRKQLRLTSERLFQGSDAFQSQPVVAITNQLPAGRGSSDGCDACFILKDARQ